MKNCKFCQNSFEQPMRGRAKLFCSRKCQMNNLDEQKRKSQPVTVERSCKNCGESFIKSRSSHRKVCSTNCYKFVNKKCKNCNKQITSKSEQCRSCSQLGRQPWNKKFSSRSDERTVRRLRETSAAGLSRTQRTKLLKLWQNQNLSCSYCSTKCETVDHVIPLIRGGSNFVGNLVPACRRCNSSKGSKLLIEWKHYARPTS